MTDASIKFSGSHNSLLNFGLVAKVCLTMQFETKDFDGLAASLKQYSTPSHSYRAAKALVWLCIMSYALGMNHTTLR